MHKEQMNEALVAQLVSALLQLENQDEGSAFLADLCTTTELKAMAQRLEVARLIDAGHTYEEIEHSTGASTATISRIKRFLYSGNGGYMMIFKRLKKLSLLEGHS